MRTATKERACSASPTPFDPFDYEEPDQYKDDRRLPVPCSVCHGTDKIRFDFINKEPKTINGYTFKPGVNVTYRPCPACQDPAEAAASRTGLSADEGQSKYVAPVPVTYEYEPPPPTVIYGECRRCKDVTEIDCNGYCFNC